MSSPRLFGIVLLLLLGAASAQASTGVRVIGEDRLAAQATSRMTSWLVNHQHEVMDDALGPVGVTALEECFLGNDLPCANKVFLANGKSDLYVLASVEATGMQGRDRVVRATLWLLKRIGAPERYEKDCSGCDDDAAMQMIEELIVHVGSFDDRKGVLRVTSDPAGALIKVDGKSVGATPIDSEQRPGKHVVDVERPGYFAEQREVKVVAGSLEELVVDLRRIPPPPPPAWRAPVMVGAAAAGVLAIAGGLIALSYNEGTSCDSNKPECLNTLPGSVAALVGGSLALGGAAYLWFTRDSVAPESGSAAAPRRGGTVGVAWSTAF